MNVGGLTLAPRHAVHPRTSAVLSNRDTRKSTEINSFYFLLVFKAVVYWDVIFVDVVVVVGFNVKMAYIR